MERVKRKPFSAQRLRNEFGARVRYLREKREWTQEKLAEEINRTRSFIGPLERGETPPSLETIGRLAYAFDIPVYQLFLNQSEVETKLRLAFEWMDLVAEQPERQADFLVTMARESRKRYSS